MYTQPVLHIYDIHVTGPKNAFVLHTNLWESLIVYVCDRGLYGYRRGMCERERGVDCLAGEGRARRGRVRMTRGGVSA